MLKLAFFQRWLDILDLQKIRVELRGSAIGDVVLRAELLPSTPPPKELHGANIMAVFGPLDFFSEGTIEFVTFIGDDPVPQHTYRLDVTIDESLKLDA